MHLMSPPLQAASDSISTLQALAEPYPAPQVVAANALQQDFAGEYRRSIDDPESFWGEQARGFHWERPWERVLDGSGPGHRWFVGGRLNITVNALDRHAHSPRTNQVAYIWLGEDGSERIVTFGQLFRLVCRFANGLKSLGVNRGDRVILYMPLTLEGIVAMLACARVGAIHSVVYAGLGHAALRARLEDARAKVVIAADVGFRRGKAVPLKPVVDEALDGVAFVEKVVVLSRQGPFQQQAPREVDFNALLEFPADCPAEVMEAEDPLFILYTSGTTGKPKGVVHVHGGFMVGTTYHLHNFFDVGVTDVFWCTSDIGWIVGHSYIVYAPLCAGVTTVLREGAIDYPDPGVAWAIVERYRVSKMFTAPTAIRMFMRYGEKYPQAHDLSSLRLIACAGEPLNPEAWRWAQTHLCGDGEWGYCVDNWWQTELAAPTIGTPCTLATRPGKAGVAQAGVVAEVVNPDGTPCPPNQGGRLVLRRPVPHMMRTVWGDPGRWEKEWTVIAGGYDTGDLALKDEEGYISLLGRADDVLNIAGHRLGTAEVESALVAHPAVAEAAAIGLPDPLKGEVIKCFVQLRAGQEASDSLAAALVNHVRGELGPIATPAGIAFLEALPKTRSGKILRRYLKARELGTDTGDLSTLDG
jgi:acetyl-CoA synthetase